MAGDTFIALCQSHTLASPARNLRPQDSNAWFRSSDVKVTHCHASGLSHGVLLREIRDLLSEKNALSNGAASGLPKSQQTVRSVDVSQR
jgi:hypothetical protein